MLGLNEASAILYSCLLVFILACWLVWVLYDRLTLSRRLKHAEQELSNRDEAAQILLAKYQTMEASSHEITTKRDQLQSENDILRAQNNAIGRDQEKCKDAWDKDRHEYAQLLADRAGQLDACRAACNDLTAELDRQQTATEHWQEQAAALQIQLEDVGLQLRDRKPGAVKKSVVKPRKQSK
jgi:chromosome segregation ATPase